MSWLDFHTSKDIFDAGYCMREYDINRDSEVWIYRDERFKVHFQSVTLCQNREPDIKLAKIENVRANAFQYKPSFNAKWQK